VIHCRFSVEVVRQDLELVTYVNCPLSYYLSFVLRYHFNHLSYPIIFLICEDVRFCSEYRCVKKRVHLKGSKKFALWFAGQDFSYHYAILTH